VSRLPTRGGVAGHPYLQRTIPLPRTTPALRLGGGGDGAGLEKYCYFWF